MEYYDTRTVMGKMLQRNGISTRLYSANYGTEYREHYKLTNKLYDVLGDDDYLNKDYYNSLNKFQIESLKFRIKQYGIEYVKKEFSFKEFIKGL
jgi:hypothetical protein